MSDTQSAELETYHGLCHCGKFAYEFRHAPLKDSLALRCNCSVCTEEDPSSYLRFTSGSPEEMSTYRFNQMIITHYFCSTCGGNILEKWPEEGEYGVNLRYVKGVDLNALKVYEYDGISK